VGRGQLERRKPGVCFEVFVVSIGAGHSIIFIITHSNHILSEADEEKRAVSSVGVDGIGGEGNLVGGVGAFGD